MNRARPTARSSRTASARSTPRLTRSRRRPSNGAAIRDADIYVTHTPCIHCLKVLINTGIRTVYYGREYKLHTVGEVLKHAAVKLVQVAPEDADAPA